MNALKVLFLVACFAIGYALSSCSQSGDASVGVSVPAAMPDGKTDGCGFTWKKARPAATVITLSIEPDWRKYQGACASLGVKACTTIDVRSGLAAIQLTRPLDESLGDTGACNPVWHELKHGMGYDHAEAHLYQPRDHTQ